MKRLAFIVLACSSLSVPAAVYDAGTGYVTLLAAGSSSSDSPLNFTTANDSKAGPFWSDGQAIHAGTNYYIRSNVYVRTPYPGNVKVDGASVSEIVVPSDRIVLAGAGQISLKTYAPSSIVFANDGIFCLGNSRFAVNDGSLNDFVVKGTVTLQETSQSAPFRLQPYNGINDQKIRLDAKVVAPAATDWVYVPRSTGCYGTVKFMGDMTDFHGVVDVSSNRVWFGDGGLPSATARVALNNAAECCIRASAGAAVTVNRIDVNTGSVLDVAADNALTVRDLRFTTATSGLRARFVAATGAAGRITAESVSLPASGAPVRVSYDPADLPSLAAEPKRLVLLRAPKGSLSADRFVAVDDSGYDIPLTLSVESGEERDELVATWGNVVTLTQAIGSAGVAGNFGKGEYWSNGRTPGQNAGYDFVCPKDVYVPRLGVTAEQTYVFPGRTLVLQGTSTIATSGAYEFSHLVFTGGKTSRVWTGGTATIGGRITVAGSADQWLTLVHGNTTTYRWAADVSGDPGIIVQMRKPDTIGNERRAYFEPSGDNSGFRGSWVVRYDESSGAYPYVNPTQFIALVVREAKNLGAPLPAFKYDALEVREWQALMASEAVPVATLDDATRGIRLKGNAYLEARTNHVLAITAPVTWNGHARFIGGGVLALGGERGPRFGDAGDRTAAADEVLEVVDGDLQALSARAVDGLPVVFGARGGIRVDPACTDAEVLAKGLVNTAAAVPFARAEGVEAPVPVTVALADTPDRPLDHLVACAVCTVAAGQADAVKGMLQVVKPGSNLAARLEEQDNADGSVTILAKVAPGGFQVILR